MAEILSLIVALAVVGLYARGARLLKQERKHIYRHCMECDR